MTLFGALFGLNAYESGFVMGVIMTIIMIAFLQDLYNKIYEHDGGAQR